MSSLIATVSCPHCGSVGSHNTGIQEGNTSAFGEIYARCTNDSCRQQFRIVVQNGRVQSTNK
jgi:hypothetical protein